KGVILGVAAFAIGGRLIATDVSGVWTRVDDTARLVADALGLASDATTLADPEARRSIARWLASAAAAHIVGAPLDGLAAALQLTEPLERPTAPQAITCSGGVSEYVFGYETRDYGDIARLLATDLCRELSQRSSLPLIDPGQRIRATVIGASQFTVQVSGKTIYLPDPGVLPVHNVPVVHVGIDLSAHIERAAVVASIRASLDHLDLDPHGLLAVAFSWRGDPEYSRLAAAGRAILEAAAPEGKRDRLLLVMIDGDIGRSFGRLLHEELGLSGPLAAIDGVQLQELDFVDVGEMI